MDWMMRRRRHRKREKRSTRTRRHQLPERLKVNQIPWHKRQQQTTEKYYLSEFSSLSHCSHSNNGDGNGGRHVTRRLVMNISRSIVSPAVVEMNNKLSSTVLSPRENFTISPACAHVALHSEHSPRRQRASSLQKIKLCRRCRLPPATTRLIFSPLLLPLLLCYQTSF